MNGKSQKVYTNKEVLENERGSPQKYIKNKEVLENERGCPQCKKKKKKKKNKEVLGNLVVESLIKMGSPKKYTQTRKSLKMY